MRSLVVIAAIAVASVSAEFHCPTFAEFFSDLVFQTKPRFLVQCFDDSAFASGCLLGGNYRGCFEDSMSRRSLHTMMDSGPDMSLELCGTLAQQIAPYPQFAVQSGTECFVGDFRGNWNDPRPESECNARCAGNTDEQCGGRWRNTLFDQPKRRATTCHWTQGLDGSRAVFEKLGVAPSLSLGGGRTPIPPNYDPKKMRFPKDFIRHPQLKQFLDHTKAHAKDRKVWPKVSVITPTYNKRHAIHPRLYGTWLSQTYHKLGEMELLFIDDGDKYQPRHSAPSPYLIDLATNKDPRVWYEFHSGPKLSIGEKRNWLNAHATGEIVVQFDDDDYYHPRYVEMMVRAMLDNKADMVKLCAYFMYGVYEKKFIYVDQCKSRPNAYGFSYVYRKSLYDKGVRFQAKSLMEDDFFLNHAERILNAKIVRIPEERGDALKVVTGTGCTGMPLERTGDVIYDQLPQFLKGTLYGSLAHIEQYLKRPY